MKRDAQSHLTGCRQSRTRRSVLPSAHQTMETQTSHATFHIVMQLVKWKKGFNMKAFNMKAA